MYNKLCIINTKTSCIKVYKEVNFSKKNRLFGVRLNPFIFVRVEKQKQKQKKEIVDRRSHQGGADFFIFDKFI